MQIARPEHPRPQFERGDWMNLNGEWEFETDNERKGMELEYFKRNSLSGKINVPFCPESELSGINNKDFMCCVWYRRDIEIPSCMKDKNVILHFGAVDYHATVYVNGDKAGEHKGGFCSFELDITLYLKDSGNYITVCAVDDHRSHTQPAGKQSEKYNSYSCFYTRTTGIWQTVWMEFVDECHIIRTRYYPNISAQKLDIQAEVPHACRGLIISARAFYDGKLMGETKAGITSNSVNLTVNLSELHLWEIGRGRLYDLELSLIKDGEAVDFVKSYFGMREVSLDDKCMRLNGRVFYGRWVLDQGFYPEGIYTAPTDEALRKDIEYGLELGFNGARLHEKIFEERYLYHADRLGYLVWGEHGNWGLDVSKGENVLNFLPEWIEAVERDFNHPSIIGWCPFNETWDFQNERNQYQNDDILSLVYKATKALDKTRPVIDTSGNFHVITDIFDVHEYRQEIDVLREEYGRLKDGILTDRFSERQPYDGKPVFVSEYGGAKWCPEDDDSWGYGDSIKTEEEYIQHYRDLTETFMFNENILGFCYTQLYDVEQEKNGLMTYDRKHKFNPQTIKEINTQPAAIEKIASVIKEVSN